MKRYAVPETQPKQQQQRCCAKCFTPYNCGNQDCACHGLTLERLISSEATR